jgi:hypothetical protein
VSREASQPLPQVAEDLLGSSTSAALALDQWLAGQDSRYPGGVWTQVE